MKFTVEGKPQGKARARTFYNRRLGKMQSITPEKTVDYEDLVRWSYKAAGGEYYGRGLFVVHITAVYEVPTSYLKNTREMALRGEIKPAVKPDIDNIVKSILDALNGVAYYDDSEVIGLTAEKMYGENARVVVELKQIKGAEE